jgi:hypothetical protein
MYENFFRALIHCPDFAPPLLDYSLTDTTHVLLTFFFLGGGVIFFKIVGEERICILCGEFSCENLRRKITTAVKKTKYEF